MPQKIAAYATRADRPDFPFWPMQFDNITIRLFGSDDFSATAQQHAARDLTAAAGDQALKIAIGDPLQNVDQNLGVPIELVARIGDRDEFTE